VDASEPDLMVAIGLKASWPVSSGRDEDHVTAVRRDSRGIGKLTVALDASVTVHGQQVRCWDATSRRIRACHPNVDCTGAIGIGQEIVCDGNESDIVSIVAGNGFNAATVGLPADVGYGDTVGVWDTTCWSADAVVVNKRTNHLPGITRDKIVSFGIKAREACIRT